MKTSLPNFVSRLLFFSFTFFLIGCGAKNIVIQPNYESIDLKITESNSINAKVINVIDRRNEEPNNAGTCQVGLMNKTVPYKLGEPVADFVKKSVTKLLSNQNDSIYLPLKISINYFFVSEHTGAFSENGYFDCDLTFVYPINSDSLKSFNASVREESSGMDVTDGLEKLMYQGISKCTDLFVANLNKIKPAYPVSTSDSVLFKNNTEHKTIITSTDSVKKGKPRTSSNANIGAAYCSGNNVNYGVQLAYQNYDSLGSNLWGGFGYTLLYYDVENKSKFLEGSFVNFNYRYFLRYHLTSGNSGPYIGAGLKLTFGTETIEYYTKKETNFFVGPTLEEVLGISISNAVFLEVGSYQLKLFGSDLLPDDIGYTIGLYFRI